MKGRPWLAVVAAVLLAGCSALPDKPVRPTLYDFGPLTGEPTQVTPTLPALVLGDVDAAGSLEGTSMMYRLGYADATQLRPYAFARWSAQPALLVRQRLREILGRERLVLDGPDAAALARSGSRAPLVLRVELEEFSHYFESAERSTGLLRLRCTLLENTPGGERLLGQRSFNLQRPAPTPDAPGGVRALAAATEAAAGEIARWIGTQGR
ncbi:ABC-type transport auxiliary lipoprotein family protein [Ramlibacter albus]|uniref:Membrane integrity-associated transporter subunit PqiC n=1 Tax=Ramlibacter albus TaxID=2079448 RepID=A0A923M4Z1_9BURK|nr:ABC-type transport auxiliary lipoprotein family protein [Ramlibacter albus]MBC5763480.1 membrane integrity-associated transporter subunit PqiC [Ramlibacter albus]